MAKYRVKSKEGELTFGSFGEVERAWLQGLVEPEDEVLEEGSTRWRKAKSIPLLAGARRTGNQVWGGTQHFWIIFVVVLASLALYWLVKGKWALGGGLSLLISLVLFRITTNAYKRSKPHR